MPHFSETGHDVVICQRCARLIDTGVESVSWRPDIVKNDCAANVCAVCVHIYDFNKRENERAKKEGGLGSQLKQFKLACTCTPVTDGEGKVYHHRDCAKGDK